MLIGGNVLTLADWAKRLDPDGNMPIIVELLAQTNEILLEMLWIEGNLPTGHRVTVRTGLPEVFWRLLNRGVTPSKSTTAQVDEQTGMLEAWSEVDKDLAELNANLNAFRLSEARAFIEAMNQEMAATIFYGNSGVAPEEFTGLAPRYSDLAADNAQNIITGGGAGADNTSLWLVVWSDQCFHGIFPKGSKAGLIHEDLGLVTVEATAGIAGARMRAYQDHWQWKPGIALKDWRYVVRIANLDISDLTTGAGAADLLDLMTRAMHRIPMLGLGRPAFYANRTVRQMLDIQAANKVNVYLTVGEEEGRLKTMFRGVPIRTCDALLNTEAAVV